VQDIDNHQIIDIPIATRGGVVIFKQQGNVMLIIDHDNHVLPEHNIINNK